MPPSRGRWVGANADWLRVAAVVVGGAVVLLWGNQVSLGRLFWATLVTLGLLAGIQILVGAARQAPEPEPQPDTADRPGEALVR